VDFFNAAAVRRARAAVHDDHLVAAREQLLDECTPDK
jgi:hypothetical protein